MNADNILILIVAGTVFLFLMGIYKMFFERTVQARERVQEVITSPTGRVQGVGLSMRPHDDVVLKRRKRPDEDETFMDRIETDLERANMAIRVNEFILMCVGTAVVGFLFVMFILGQHPVVAVLAGGAALFLPVAMLNIKIWLRMGKAAAQFADILDALISCFKTGFGFNRAIQTIADNFDDPWGTEFGKIAAEMNLGANQETVLYNLSRRIPSPDVDLFVTALLIQKETGGNMAELLGNLSHTIRERYKLKRKVSAISAQGKLSAGIVTCVPFFLMGLIYLFLPDPVTKFVINPIGIIILIAAGVWMAIGICVLFKIVQIEV